MEMTVKLTQIDSNRWQIAQDAEMKVGATIYSSKRLGLESSAVEQLRDAACLGAARKVLATPDIHQGYGVPIGCVMALEDAVMPAAVGYDINCGMRLLTTELRRGDFDPDPIARSIARDIPLGEGKSNLPLTRRQLDAVATEGVRAVEGLAGKVEHRAWEAYDAGQLRQDIGAVERSGSLPGKIESVPHKAIEKGAGQLGTLGGGNHFIEIQTVEKVFDDVLAKRFGIAEGLVTVMIHSGSRRFGYEVADEYMRLAASVRNASGRDRQLAYLNVDDRAFDAYIGAMHAAGNFAYVNRQIMTLLVRRCFRRAFGPMELPLVYDVSHNMAQLERHLGGELWIHRKGATRAFGPARMSGAFADCGQPVIIPGSMGTGSYLLVGCDQSEEALCSVNHGAGRTMSRTAAAGKRSRLSGKVIRPAAISDEEFRDSMSGITLIAGNKSAVKEEAPAAYKDIDAVIEVVVAAKLARPVARLRPLAVLKG